MSSAPILDDKLASSSTATMKRSASDALLKDCEEGTHEKDDNLNATGIVTSETPQIIVDTVKPNCVVSNHSSKPAATIAHGGSCVGTKHGTTKRKKITPSSNANNTHQLTTTNTDKIPATMTKEERIKFHEELGYKPLTLHDIYQRIKEICYRIPKVPVDGFVINVNQCSDVSNIPTNKTDDTKTNLSVFHENVLIPKQEPSNVEIKAIQLKQFQQKKSPSKGLHRYHHLNNHTSSKQVIVKTARQREQEEVRSLGVLSSQHMDASYNKLELLNWATALQGLLDECRLIVATVSAATYTWGTDRSGAAEQNLSLLRSELANAQDQIELRVTAYLNNIIAPVVSIVNDEVITSKYKITSSEEIPLQVLQSQAEQQETASPPAKLDTKSPMIEKEIKENYFLTTYQDPDYVNYCYSVVAKNAVMLRHVVLANLDKSLRAIADYLIAQVSDNQNDSRGYVY